MSDRRQEKTRSDIISAFVSLISDSSNKKVTITQIAKKANICRKTFYLHYQSTEDIVKDIEKMLKDETLKRTMHFFAGTDQSDLSQIIYDFDEIVIQYLDLIRKIAQSPYKKDFIRIAEGAFAPSVQVILEKQFHIQTNIEYYVDYYSAGVATIYIDWLEDPKGLSLKELADIVVQVCLKGISS